MGRNTLVSALIFIAIHASASNITIDPACGANWTACGVYGVDTVYFEPGDYRSFGQLVPTANNRVFLYFDWDTITIHGHIVNADSTSWARLESFEITGFDNIKIEGLVFDGVAGGIAGYGRTSFIQNGASNNTIRHCLFQDWASSSAIRIRSASNYNTIRDCVIRNCYQGVSDNMGILIQSSFGTESVGNAIRNNEIYNTTDGVQFNFERADNTKNGYVPGTIIDSNEIYLTDERLFGDSLACAENAIDCKVCATNDADSSRCQITNNVFHHFRRTQNGCLSSGSDGASVVIQFDTRNMLLSGNYIFDGVKAFRVEQGGSVGDTTRNITIKHNLIFDIHTHHSQDDGVSVHFETITSSIVFDSNYIADINAFGVVFNLGVNAEMRWNRFIDCDFETPSTNLVSGFATWNAWQLSKRGDGTNTSGGYYLLNSRYPDAEDTQITIYKFTNPTVVKLADYISPVPTNGVLSNSSISKKKQ